MISDDDMHYYVYDEGEYNDSWNKTSEWSYMCETCSSECLHTFEEDLDWYSALKNPNMTKELIAKNKDKIDLEYFNFFDCSLVVIEEFQNEMNWDKWNGVSTNENLSIDFIRRNKDKLDFDDISEWASLEILEEFEDNIN